MIESGHQPIKKLQNTHTTLSACGIILSTIKNKIRVKVLMNVKEISKRIYPPSFCLFHGDAYKSLKQPLMKALFLICFPALSIAGSFFEEHASGWFWYQDSLKEENQSSILPPPINPTRQMKAYQKRMEDSLNLAILNPTEANLKTYAKNYFEVVQKAQRFTDAYQLMLLKHPGFDYSLQFPLNALSQQVYAKQKEQSLEATIRAFAREHGFFFFFSPACQYCHLFAPIVKNFAEKYGITVLAINLDSEPYPNLKEFPNAIPDNGAARLFKITYLPSLFVVNPKTTEVIPLANGFISLSQLEENLMRVIEAKKHSQNLKDNPLEVAHD